MAGDEHLITAATASTDDGGESLLGGGESEVRSTGGRTAHVGSAATWHAMVGRRGRTDRILGDAPELGLT